MRAWALALWLTTGMAQADPVPFAADALNALRASRGEAAVSVSAALQAAAEAHAQDMARQGYFAHQSPDGRGLAQRLRAQGYGYCFAAENIAQGQLSLNQVMASWRGSSGHLRNMLDGRATEFGLARAPGNLWVMVLGRPGC